jgi:hypothetical protein
MKKNSFDGVDGGVGMIGKIAGMARSCGVYFLVITDLGE